MKKELEDVGDKINEGLNTTGKVVVNEYHEVEEFFNNASHVINKVFQDACACSRYSCGCCAHLQEPHIQLNATLCTNITYLVHDYGISFTITVNNYAIFNETISARNPPPVCLGLPYVKQLADLCVRLYDINATANYLHVCVRVEARMKKILVAKYELGCFNIGPVAAVTFEAGGGNDFKLGNNGILPDIVHILAASPDAEVTTERVDEAIVAKIKENETEDKSSGILIPVLASLGAIILICAVAFFVYISIKKKRDEQKRLLFFSRQYGSTALLQSDMDPYC
ncbi:hypothetical protein L9F63_019263 [Diploptera punctata]|uniref:DUF4773 domain-containing protein n=1 Tax=Diploptera punctata TaxID=6984 RepID=A0AAD7ZUT1_DIPPU|nr:hypothetical protein L9F63_019263 [Diploptera punctata]